MFDKLWHPNLEEQEAVELMVKGVEEVRRRLVVAPSSYQFKIVDANGIRDVTPAELRGHTQQGPTQMNIQQPPEVMVS
jgi:20S proteasome alpha/beta subunit